MATVLGSVSIIPTSGVSDENCLKEVQLPEHGKKCCSVSFVEDVKTILIPTIPEYKKAGLFTLLWWDRFDYEMFKLGAMKEIDFFLTNHFSKATRKTVNSNSNDNNSSNNYDSCSSSYCIQEMNIQTIMKKLYQPIPVERDNNSLFENENIDVNVIKNSDSMDVSVNGIKLNGSSSSSSSSSSSTRHLLATSPTMNESDINKQLYVLD